MSRARSQPSPMVARLLHFDERDPRAEIVRHAGPGQVHLSRMDVRAVQRAADALGVMAADGVGEPVTLDPGDKADPGMRRLGAIAGCLEQDPGLRLAEPRAQVRAGPVPGRAGVQRRRARGREQLDQDTGDGSPAFGKAGADHLLGQGFDYLRERYGPDAWQLDRAHALRAAVGIAVAGPGARAHPVL